MFLFRLASHLGKTVKQLLRQLDSAELTEWMAFSNIEPLWGRRLDYVGALIACVAGNPWREEALDLADLMPRWEEMRESDGDPQMRAGALALGAFAGTLPPELGGRDPDEDEPPKRAERPQRPARKTTHLRDPANDPRRKGKK